MEMFFNSVQSNWRKVRFDNGKIWIIDNQLNDIAEISLITNREEVADIVAASPVMLRTLRNVNMMFNAEDYTIESDDLNMDLISDQVKAAIKLAVPNRNKTNPFFSGNIYKS